MKGQKVFRFNKRFYTYIISIILIICVLLSVLILSKDEKRIMLLYSPSENGAVVLSDGDLTGKTVSGKGISKVVHNSDNTACAVLMSDGAYYSLYTVKHNSVKKLTENGTSDFVFSFSGKKAVYATGDGQLYSGKKPVSDSVSAFAVSPDCSAVLFSKTEENVSKLYLFSKGKVTYINEGYTPLAVSSDGKLLYVLSGDNSLFILNSDGSMQSKLCSGAYPDSFSFSSDLKRIVFSDGEYTYISEEGKSRVRLVPGVAKPVTLSGKESRLNSAGTAFVCDSKDLTEIFYVVAAADDMSDIYYVNEDFSRLDAAQSVKKYIITGKSRMTYLDNMGKIYKFDGVSELVVSGASDLEAVSNNKYIYYMTTAKELYSVKRSNIQIISASVYKIYKNDDDKLFIVTTDKTLYSVSGAKKSELIASDVLSCVCDGDVVGYSTSFAGATGTSDFYTSTDGKNFSLAASGVKKQ